MFRWRKILWLSLLLFGGAPMFAASSAERRAFNAAAEAFSFNSWAVAETDFGRFAQKYPESERFSEAVLLQAQARYYMTQYNAAITLLSANQGKAGWWADQYLFWIAESQLAGGNLEAAADSYARLAQNFPISTHRLTACVREAEARARLQEWSRVIELLQKPDGIFQQAIKSGAADELAATGFLILGDAQFAQKDFAGANNTLEWLARQGLNPTSAWRRGFLEYRVRLAENQLEGALQSATNMIASARAARNPVFLARSVEMQAEVFEQQKRLDEAMAAYQANLVVDAPVEQQRIALLKVAELSLAQDKISEAVQTLGNFLSQYTNSAAADLALLTLGELQLKQYLADSTVTNLLTEAAESFEKLLHAYPNSSLAGKAWLNKGWCLWSQDQFAQSLAAFQSAALLLPFSKEQAVARFKWADAQFRLKDFAGSLTNYSYLVANHAALPGVRDELLEPALYQSVRAALETGNLDAATNALEKILEWYPQGLGDRGLLLTGQRFSHKKNPVGARELFARFGEMYPTNVLAPQVQLALARSYEQETNWVAVITNYDLWIGTFTNHPDRPSAEFERAWASFMAGRDTNAFVLFTNFVAQFTNSPLVLQAHWWLGDYHFQRGDFIGAEGNYQLVFKNTNWPPSELTYQAKMMAGRAAVARQSNNEATNYFSSLATDSNCPIQLRLQANLACGDALMSRTDSDATNHAADLGEAIGWFRSVAEKYPTNELAAPAWGLIGNCYLQLAASGTNLFYNLASNAYQQVLNLPLASVAARCQAEVGMGLVAEKQARQKSGDERAALLRQAMDNYHDVFLGSNLRDGEHLDLYWVKEAGLKAYRVASEELNDWPLALNICSNLAEKFPQVRPVFENKLRLAQEHMAREKK